jgi:rRNA biogenesis protein RRP5
MKILGQVYAVQPLALIISLPNQLFGHVPITNITSQLTQSLEALDEDEPMSSAGSGSNGEGEGEDEALKAPPELSELFHPGQYVRALVSAVHAPGATDVVGLGQRAKDDVEKASRRVELSLLPESVNAGVAKADLKKGFVSVFISD